MVSYTRPRHLSIGDIVATVSLSRGWPGEIPTRYEAGKRQLEEEFGVHVREMPNTLKPDEWIYNHPEARAQDLMQAFKDPEIKGIFSTIWGEESIRILPYIDLDVIKNNPKVFMWYSDTTITHFICQKAGIISFYGPSIMAGFGESWGMFPYMVDAVRKSVFSADPIGVIKPNLEGWTNEFLAWDDPENQHKKRKQLAHSPRRWLQWKGTVTWQLLGGCIDVFPFMIGTSIRPTIEEWKDKILFLEPSEEKISSVHFERIIRNLGSQGILHVLKGIIVGRAQMDYEKWEQLNYDEQLMKIINKELWLTDLPVVTNMDFGHTDPMFVLPLWINAELDCEHKTFSIPEAACI